MRIPVIRKDSGKTIIIDDYNFDPERHCYPGENPVPELQPVAEDKPEPKIEVKKPEPYKPSGQRKYN